MRSVEIGIRIGGGMIKENDGKVDSSIIYLRSLVTITMYPPSIIVTKNKLI
jgi:hypothetical protein